MSDFETELRELLRDRAEAAAVEPALPRETRRAARRRRIASVLTSIAIVAGVAGGAVASVQAVKSSPKPAHSPVPGPTRSDLAEEGAFPGIWPEQTWAQTREAQLRVDAGTDEWRDAPAQVARHFARVVLGWRATQIDILEGACDAMNCTPVSITNKELTDTDGKHATAELELFRLLGDGSIWSVVSVSSSAFQVDCPSYRTRDIVIGRKLTVCGELAWDPTNADVEVSLLGRRNAPITMLPNESSPRSAARVGGSGIGSDLYEAGLGTVPGFGGSRSATLVVRLMVGGETVGVSARRFGLEEPSPIPGPTQTPSPEAGEYPVPAVWPETNMQDIETAQANPPAWRLDASETALRFAIDVLGWRDAYVSRIGGDEAKGSVVLEEIQGSHGGNVGYAPNTNRIDLHLAQKATRGPGGIWSVIDVWSPHLQFQAGDVNDYSPDCLDVERHIVRGSGASMCARISGLAPATSVKSVRVAIFEGTRVSLAHVPTSVVRGELNRPLANDYFYGGLTECVCGDASILLVEAIDQNGDVIAVATERIGPETSVSHSPARRRGTFIGMWPLHSDREVEKALVDLRAGRDLWLRDARTVAVRFAEHVLGWPRHLIGVDGDEARPGQAIYAVWNRDINRKRGLRPNDRATATTMLLTEQARCEGHITDWYICYTDGTTRGPKAWTAYRFQTELLDLRSPGKGAPRTLRVGQAVIVAGEVRDTPPQTSVEVALEPVRDFRPSSGPVGGSGGAGHPWSGRGTVARRFELRVPVTRFVKGQAVLVIRVLDSASRVIALQTRRYTVVPAA